MKRALIISHNLIGDALIAGIAIREFFRQKSTFENPDTGEFDVIDLLTQQDHVTRLYSGLRVEWSDIYTDISSVEYEKVEPYDKIFTLGAGDAGAYVDSQPEPKPHIVEGFAHQLEIELPKPNMETTPYGNFRGWKPFYDPFQSFGPTGDRGLELREQIISIGDNWILFSPFSASCSSRKGQPPNKMLKPEHWIPIIEFMRTLGPIRMLGAPDDKPDERWQLSEDEIMTGVPLDWLAAVMKKSKLVITIDNGMGHLADSQDANHILLYPQCLSLGFIISWGCKNLVPIQMEPNEIAAMQLMWSIKRAIKYLGI